jgi:hypothetical protein
MAYWLWTVKSHHWSSFEQILDLVLEDRILDDLTLDNPILDQPRGISAVSTESEKLSKRRSSEKELMRLSCSSRACQPGNHPNHSILRQSGRPDSKNGRHTRVRVRWMREFRLPFQKIKGPVLGPVKPFPKRSFPCASLLP